MMDEEENVDVLHCRCIMYCDLSVVKEEMFGPMWRFDLPCPMYLIITNSQREPVEQQRRGQGFLYAMPRLFRGT